MQELSDDYDDDNGGSRQVQGWRGKELAITHTVTCLFVESDNWLFDWRGIR